VFKTDPIWSVCKPNTSFRSVCTNIGVLLGIAFVKIKDKLEYVYLWNKDRLEFIRVGLYMIKHWLYSA